MANVATFTITSEEDQETNQTELLSVSGSNGSAGFSSSNRIGVDPGDTVTFTASAFSSGTVGVGSVDLNIWTKTGSNIVTGDVILTAKSGVASTIDNITINADVGGGTLIYLRNNGTALSGTLTPSTIATRESQGGVTVTSNINIGGFYYWDLERNAGEPAGSVSFGFNSPTSGSFSATANTNVNINTGAPNQSAGSTSNIGYQGVGFTIDTFTGASRTGTKIATSNWTIYEDITGTSVSPSSQTLADTTTTFSVNVTTNWRGSNSVALRIRNTTTNSIVDTFSTSNGSTTISRTITAPSAGSTNDYRVEAYNGNSYRNGDTFSVTRNSPPDRTPEGFTVLGGSKTNATPNTTFYATFSSATVVAINAADAAGLALGSTIDNGTPIIVSNGEWSIDKTNWSSSTSTVNAAQVVYFRGTSASSGSTTHSLTIGTETQSFTTNTSTGSVVVDAEYDTEISSWSVNLSSGTGTGLSSGSAREITAGTTVTFNNVGYGVGADIDFGSFAEWTNNNAQNNIPPGTSFTKTWASGVLGNTLDPILLNADVTGNPQTFVYFRQPPVAPDLEVTPSNTTMAYNAGTVDVSVADVTSGETYEVHEENNATSLGSAVASGTSVTITATIGNAQANTTGNLAIDRTKTYEIYSRRPTSLGGDNLPNATNDVFTIQRLVEPLNNVDTITFSPASTASSTTSVTVDATGGSGGTVQVRQGTSGTWSLGGTAFSLTRGTPYTFQARRIGAQDANATTPIQDSYTPPYLLPDRDITFSRSPSGNIAATYSGNVVVSIANGTADNRYRVLRTTNGNLGCGNTGLLTGTTGTVTIGDAVNELPTAALTDQTFSYTLQARRGIDSGGDDLTWYTVTSSPSTFTITRDALDDDPDQFTFTNVSDVARSTTQTSNLITIGGIDTTVNVSVSGGTYRKNETGGFTASTGTAVNGDKFEVQHTSSAAFSTSVNTTLTVGTTSDTFTSTTLAEDTTPGAFTFNDVTGVAPSTTQTSNTITVSDINSTANVSVTGGTYRKNGTGGFTASDGTAVNGDDFEVQHTSSSDPLTSVNTELTIGGISDTFTSTTRDITAPTANNVTVNNPESATYTATFNLSNVGQDGTLQYAIEKNDSSPDNWTNAATDSTSSFTANFTRTSSPGTIYAQARRSTSKTSLIVSVAGRGFIAPANITCSNQNIATTFTGDLLVGISGGISTKEAYAVSLSTGLASANVVANSIDVINPYDGSNFTIPSANLPSNGNTTTYYLYAGRFTTYGGSGAYSEVGSFTVQRASTVATPTGFTVTDVVGSGGTYTSSTSTTNNLAADSLAGHTLQFRADSGTWTTSTQFTHNYGATRVYEARYVRDSDSEVTANPPSITRQVADAEITISPVTSILSTNSTNPLKIADISGATADTQYRARATGNINGSSVTDLFIDAPTATNSTPDINAANPTELPAAGTSATYTIMVRVGDIDDGDDLYRFLRTGIANRSWTLTRTSPGTSPDQFSFSAPTTNDDNISVTVTASYSGSTPAGTIQLSETSNFASIQANGSSFDFVRGTPKTIYARLSNAGEFSTPSSESHTPAYLNAQTSISAPTGFDSNLNFTQSGNETVSIVGGNIAGNTYRVRRTSPSVVQCGNTGELGASATGTVTIGDAANELPGSGEVFSYDVQAQKSVSTGGDGTSWAATGETFSIGRQNNWNFASVSSATSNVTYNASAQVNGLVGTLTVTRSGSGTFAVSSSATTPSSGFSTASKSITNGQYIHARITASSSPGTTLTQTFTIDGQSSSFGVTTPLSGGGGGGGYGLQIFDENSSLVLDTNDRTGQVAYKATITANGGPSYNSVTTTTTNLPTSFDSEGVTSDSEIVIITGDSRTKAFLQDNGATSPKWSVKTVRQGTGSTTVTVIVVHLGDVA